MSRSEQQKWTGFGNRNVIVTGGKVHLWGLVGSEEERKALRALVEGVPGVKSVEDEMIAAYKKSCLLTAVAQTRANSFIVRI
ncbi:hypothetical protein FHS20_003759 [Phyllobacterium endophyticum]|nr:hypothetical protein [Phyllobacterium endophyticum]